MAPPPGGCSGALTHARTHAEVLEGTFRGRFTHENDGWGSSGEPQGKRASWGRGWEWRQAGLGAEEKLPG